MADRECRLAAGDRQRLHDKAARRLPKPVAGLIMKGDAFADSDNVHVVSQAIEELRAVGLRIDRVHLDALEKLTPFGTLGFGIDVDTFASLPNAGETP